MELVCVYCSKPLREHDPSPHGGAVWRQCRDGSGRPVHLDIHFITPPGARWCGEPNRARLSMVKS